jgi:hypothetical protein
MMRDVLGNAADLRNLAGDCIRLAELAHDEKIRAGYLLLAAGYLKMAEAEIQHAEAKTGGRTAESRSALSAT